MLDFADLNNAVLAELGESVTVHVTAGSPPSTTDTVITAAYRGPWVGTNVDGIAVDRPDRELLVRTSDWDAVAAKNGDTVTVRGVTYTVIDAQPDDADMTTVKLGGIT